MPSEDFCLRKTRKGDDPGSNPGGAIQSKIKMRVFNFRYPKLAAIVLAAIAAYFLFSNANVQSAVGGLDSLDYLGILAAGALFSFGLSTPFAIGFFLVSSPENIFLASIAGGFGAMLSDLFIFKFVKFSLMDEFSQLENTKPIKEIRMEIKKHDRRKILNYLTYIFAGIIIASPLPDEFGVGMLAGLTEIKPVILGIVSLLMNSLGIFIILLIGSSV